MGVPQAITNIQNVVASATLGQELDLDSIVRVFPGVEYRPARALTQPFTHQATDSFPDDCLMTSGCSRVQRRVDTH
ncbi:hypothetical protein MUP05_09410 [Candidatus Bathyarchaeota archaeon]|nr:hypothetical protein [Candidatus Bathyarchaeota archaeon]